MDVTTGAGTDRGRKRLLNEDSLYYNEAMGLFLLADGMGGHKAGEVASKMAIETIVENFKETLSGNDHPVLEEYNKKFLKETNILASSIRLSNHKIYETAQKKKECHGMGATIIAVFLSNNIMSMAYVGDSRIYLIRDSVLKQITTDHSLVAEHIKKGLISKKEARKSRVRNVITRALGMEGSVEVDLDEQVILDNDCLLMCSDGLHDMIEDNEILDMVLSYPKEPQKACDRLLELANEHGGNDNISVILICFS